MKSIENSLEQIIGEGYSYKRNAKNPIILPPPLKGNDYQRSSLKNNKKDLLTEIETQNDKGYYEITSINEAIESSSDRLDESSSLLEADESSSSLEESSSSNNDHTLDRDLVKKFSYMLESESSQDESSSFYESDSLDESSSYSEESSYQDESAAFYESSSFAEESSYQDESESFDESSSFAEKYSYQDESNSLDKSSYSEESSCQDGSDTSNESSSYAEESSCHDESDSSNESSSYAEEYPCHDESDSSNESSSCAEESSCHYESDSSNESSSYAEESSCHYESDSSNESSSYAEEFSCHDESDPLCESSSEESDCNHDENSLGTDSTLPIVKIPVVLGQLNLDLDIYNTINLSIPIANIVNIDWGLKSFDCKVLLPSPNVFLKGELIGEIEYIKENDGSSLHLTKIRIPWDKVTEIEWINCPDLPSSNQVEYMFKSKDDKEIQFVRECHNQFACPIYPEIQHIHITWHDELLSKGTQKELDVQGRILLAINLLQSQYLDMNTYKKG